MRSTSSPTSFDAVSEDKKRGYIRSFPCKIGIVGLCENNLVEIRFHDTDYEVEVEDRMEIMNIMIELTDNGKIPYYILIVPGLYSGMTKEAREKELFDIPAYKNHYAMAAVVRSFSQRIVTKLYYLLKKTKPPYPFQMFNSEEDAKEWIFKLMEENKKRTQS